MVAWAENGTTRVRTRSGGTCSRHRNLARQDMVRRRVWEEPEALRTQWAAGRNAEQ